MKRALSILIVIVFAIVFAAQIVASGEVTEPVDLGASLPGSAEPAGEYSEIPDDSEEIDYAQTSGEIAFSDSSDNIAPEITLQTVDGRTIKTTDYLGQIVVLVTYSPPACVNARATMIGIENSEWAKDPNVKVIVVGWGSAELVISDRDQYVPGSQRIEFCYTNSLSNIVNPLRKAYGAPEENMFYNAEHFIISQTGSVYSYWHGGYKEQNYVNAIDGLLNNIVYNQPLYSYFENIDGEKISFYDYPGKITVVFFVSANHSRWLDRYMRTYLDDGILSDENIEFLVCLEASDISNETLRELKDKYGDSGAGMEFGQLDYEAFYNPQFELMDLLGMRYYGPPAFFVFGQSTKLYARVGFYDENGVAKDDSELLSVIQELRDGAENYRFPDSLSEGEIGEIYHFTVSGTKNYDMAYENLRLVNEYRVENGLEPVKMDKTLMEAAMQRAAEIAVYFDHIRPDGTKDYTVVNDYSRYYYIYENISAGHETALDAFNGWKASPGHNANMLRSIHQYVGIGCFTNENGRTFWVQDFAGDVGDTEAADITGSVLAEFNINVISSLLDIFISAPSMQIKQGESAEITVSQRNTGLSGNNYTTIGVSYVKSDDESVARVEAVGGKVNVIGVAPGEVNVTVGIVSESGKMMSATGLVRIMPAYTPADVNGDEDVTLEDAILTLQRAMKVDGGTPDFIEQAADLTGDGTITLEDAIEILKIAMKVTS